MGFLVWDPYHQDSTVWGVCYKSLSAEHYERVTHVSTRGLSAEYRASEVRSSHGVEVWGAGL